ncbi:MAG: Mur ligase family protein [Bacillota bacterium]
MDREACRIIGITGTNGKSTTGKILQYLLELQGIKAAFFDTKEMIDQVGVYDHIFAKDVDIVLLEICQSHKVFSSLEKLEFDMIVHTTIENDYVDNHTCENAYLSFANKLFRLLSSNGIVVMNTDDKNTICVLESLKNRMIITYGLGSRATVTASSMNASSGTDLACCLQRGITTQNGLEIEPMEFPIHSKMLGKHNVYNILAAITTALIYDVPIDKIVEGFKNFKGVKRRMETVFQDGCRVIDDYSHNPAGYEAVFETVQGLDYDRLYVVNAIRGGNGVELNRNNAQALVSFSKMVNLEKIITTCSQEAVDEKYKVMPEERQGFHDILEQNKINYEHREQLSDALRLAARTVGNRDLLLLLGAQGMDSGMPLISEMILKEKN